MDKKLNNKENVKRSIHQESTIMLKQPIRIEILEIVSGKAIYVNNKNKKKKNTFKSRCKY
ncbi:unnamed protein product [Paramecium sonneborni]|uniref:Uncharacterized protein n=1 Tax=Paramecium sonneborni TaxID=65129 RepID=A0A8S1RMF4_9CILI|nr:unnamed protein product [Paramecium sonneborni]